MFNEERIAAARRMIAQYEIHCDSYWWDLVWELEMETGLDQDQVMELIAHAGG